MDATEEEEEGNMILEFAPSAGWRGRGSTCNSTAIFNMCFLDDLTRRKARRNVSCSRFLVIRLFALRAKLLNT